MSPDGIRPSFAECRRGHEWSSRMRPRASTGTQDLHRNGLLADDTPTAITHSDRMATIEIKGLTKRFGDVTAVDDLSFSAREGAVTGFLGPNGAGKTTTLRMLLGLVTPTAGTATVNGRPYPELADPPRHVGAVLESTGFHPGRRARQ